MKKRKWKYVIMRNKIMDKVNKKMTKEEQKLTKTEKIQVTKT